MTKIEIGIISAIVMMVPLIVYSTIQEQKQWERFASVHDCKVVAKERSRTTTGYGIAPNGTYGTVTTTIPSKTAWLCDDGVTYWR